MRDGLKDKKNFIKTIACALFLFVILYLFSKILQEKLFSGSHNLVHVWDATGSFGLRGTIDHSFGSVYSLAATRQFIIVGKFFLLLRWPLFSKHWHRLRMDLSGISFPQESSVCDDQNYEN